MESRRGTRLSADVGARAAPVPVPGRSAQEAFAQCLEGHLYCDDFPRKEGMDGGLPTGRASEEWMWGTLPVTVC